MRHQVFISALFAVFVLGAAGALNCSVQNVTLTSGSEYVVEDCGQSNAIVFLFSSTDPNSVLSNVVIRFTRVSVVPQVVITSAGTVSHVNVDVSDVRCTRGSVLGPVLGVRSPMLLSVNASYVSNIAVSLSQVTCDMTDLSEVSTLVLLQAARFMSNVSINLSDCSLIGMRIKSFLSDATSRGLVTINPLLSNVYNEGASPEPLAVVPFTMSNVSIRFRRSVIDFAFTSLRVNGGSQKTIISAVFVHAGSWTEGLTIDVEFCTITQRALSIAEGSEDVNVRFQSFIVLGMIDVFFDELLPFDKAMEGLSITMKHSSFSLWMLHNVSSISSGFCGVWIHSRPVVDPYMNASTRFGRLSQSYIELIDLSLSMNGSHVALPLAFSNLRSAESTNITLTDLRSAEVTLSGTIDGTSSRLSCVVGSFGNFVSKYLTLQVTRAVWSCSLVSAFQTSFSAPVIESITAGIIILSTTSESSISLLSSQLHAHLENGTSTFALDGSAAGLACISATALGAPFDSIIFRVEFVVEGVAVVASLSITQRQGILIGSFLLGTGVVGMLSTTIDCLFVVKNCSVQSKRADFFGAPPFGGALKVLSVGIISLMDTWTGTVALAFHGLRKVAYAQEVRNVVVTVEDCRISALPANPALTYDFANILFPGYPFFDSTVTLSRNSVLRSDANSAMTSLVDFTLGGNASNVTLIAQQGNFSLASFITRRGSFPPSSMSLISAQVTGMSFACGPLTNSSVVSMESVMLLHSTLYFDSNRFANCKSVVAFTGPLPQDVLWESSESIVQLGCSNVNITNDLHGGSVVEGILFDSVGAPNGSVIMNASVASVGSDGRVHCMREASGASRTRRSTGGAVTALASIAVIVNALSTTLPFGSALQSSPLLQLSRTAQALGICVTDATSPPPVGTSVLDNPTQMVLDSLPASLISSGGLCVGNFLFSIGILALKGCFSSLMVWRRMIQDGTTTSWNIRSFAVSVIEEARWPGNCLATPLSLVLQPSITGASQLIASPHRNAASTVLGLFTFGWCGGTSVALLAIGVKSGWNRSAAPSADHVTVKKLLQSVRACRHHAKEETIRYVLDFFAAPHWVWHQRGGDAKPYMHIQFGDVYEAYRPPRRWFAVVDVFVPLFCGVVSSVGYLVVASCHATLWCFASICVVSLAAMLVLQPYNNRYLQLTSSVMAALTLVTCALAAAEVEDSTTDWLIGLLSVFSLTSSIGLPCFHIARAKCFITHSSVPEERNRAFLMIPGGHHKQQQGTPPAGNNGSGTVGLGSRGSGRRLLALNDRNSALEQLVAIVCDAQRKRQLPKAC